MQKLSNAKAGKYTVKWIFTEPEIDRALKDVSIEVGSEVTVIGNSRLGSMLIRSDAGLFWMRPETVAGVTV